MALQKDVILFADDGAKGFKIFCTLCGRVFREPYIASCGHTFCQGCVPADVRVNCPQDGTSISLLVKNIAVAEEVGELQVHCCYGCRIKNAETGEYEVDQEGCPVVVKLSKKEEHERECEFSPTSCPNSSSCSRMLRKDLQNHLKVCQVTPCPHAKYNCGFRGTKTGVQEHLKTCDYEGLKGVLSEMEEQSRQLRQEVESRVGMLKEELERKDGQMQDLTSTLTSVREHLADVEASGQAAARRIVSLEERQVTLEEELSQAKASMIKLLQNDKRLLKSGVDIDIDHRHQFVCQGTFVGHKGPLWDLCINGDLLFSASSDNTIKIWNLGNMYRGPKTLIGHDGIILAVCTYGDFLFSGSSDKTIKVWHIPSMELEHTIKGHEDPVCTLACTDSLLFSGSLKTIKVWNIQTREMVKKLPSQNHWVRALVAEGNYLYSGSYQSVKIWSLESLEVVKVLKCAGASVYSLAVTDRHIVCGTYENLIHVWDVQTLQEIGTLSGHVGIVYSLTILKGSGSMRLFSASYDKTIRVWNIELMTCGQILARHEGSVTCVLASSGRVFSGAVDNTIKFRKRSLPDNEEERAVMVTKLAKYSLSLPQYVSSISVLDMPWEVKDTPSS